MATLTSPGVSVSVTDQAIYGEVQPTTVPLFVLATRSNKKTPDGVNIAAGTTEANKLRVVGSQRELLQNYGSPVFVTSSGVPVHGDETNEYGLMAAHSFMGRGSRAFVIRADIDLGSLVPTTKEPISPPADNTYWLNTASAIGGIFKFDGTNWTAVPFKIYTATPTAADGADGDWAFDYSSVNGTIMFRNGGNWKAASNANIAAAFGAGRQLHVGPTSPTGASANDYWYKTVASAGGTNLSLSRYRAVDGVFVSVPVSRSNTQPVASEGSVWEDTSDIANSGKRPLYVGTGAGFIPLSMVVQSTEPVTVPTTGTLWYDSTFTDFAMYVEGTDVGFGNQWVPITTTTVSNPSAKEKVISASAPTAPQEGAIWIDISTSDKFDKFPIVMRYQGGSWIDITNSVLIQDTDPQASTVLNGTYWINNGESITKNTIKTYDPTYTPVKVTFDGTQYNVVSETGNHWKPAAGSTFGRKAVRALVVTKLQEAVVNNDELRADTNYYQLIAAPGYPELYDELIALNTDNGEVSMIVADTPKFLTPKSIPTGREVTVKEWVSNARSASTTGEEGFSSAKSPYAAFYSPWGLGTDVSGNNVMVPPSHMALRTIAYSDSVAAPWIPPAGLSRGRVDNASSVGYLDNDGKYQVAELTTSMRNTMYENSINPIMFKPSTGLVVFGQKTFASTNTVLDRVNSIRLVAKMKYDLQRLLEPFLFEINDPITRRSVQVSTERYLTGLTSMRALSDFAVRCNEENNTPSTIDQHILNVDVALKMPRSIEFIYVPITLLNSGDSFPF